MNLSYTGLVSPELVKHTQNTIGDKETLSFYIDNIIGWSTLQNEINSSSKVTIYNIGHNQIEMQFIQDVFIRLDRIIDIDFVEQSNNYGSMLDIYHVNYSSGFDTNTIGQAISQRNSAGSWWEIAWRNHPVIIGNNNDVNHNTIIHEIGHSLGLKHPFDDPFDQSWNSKDTIMSYNKGPDGWNTWFSKVDLDALISIWGRENDEGTMLWKAVDEMPCVLEFDLNF